MKKIITFIGVSLLLISCNNTPITSGSSSIESSSSESQNSSLSSSNLSSDTSSSESSSLEILPKNNDELIELINTYSTSFTLNNETSYSITKKEFPFKYSFEEYGYQKEEKLTSKRFKEEFATLNMSVTKYKSSDLENYEEMYSFSGQGYIGKYNDKYIDLKYYDTSKVPDSEYISQTNNLSSLILEESENINTYITSNISSVVTNYLSNINDEYDNYYKTNDGLLIYELTGEKVFPKDHKETYSLNITFNSNYSISKTIYTFKTFNYDWSLEAFSTSPNDHKIEEYDLNYNQELPSCINQEYTNPENYIIKDAEIGLIEQNSYDGALLDLSAIKIGTYIKPVTLSTTPSKAINNEFNIVASENEEVISLYYGSWKCIGAGSTTLTLENSNGFSKTLEVTVYLPELESISVSFSSNKFYVGKSYNINISLYPYDAVSTFNITSSDENILTVTNNNNSYSINCLSQGNASITVKSVEYPSIEKTIEVNVEEAKNSGELVEFITKNNWKCYSYDNYAYYYLSFSEDVTGRLYDDYFYVDESFTWTIEENKITVSEVSFYYNYSTTVFIDNTITIDRDNEKLHLLFSDGFYTVMNETFTIYNY